MKKSCLVFIGAMLGASVVEAEPKEYLYEGRDRSIGSFSGLLDIDRGRRGVKVHRRVQFLEREESLLGTGLREDGVLSVSFPVSRGLVGALRGRRAPEPVEMTIWFYEDDKDSFESQCTKGERLKSKGTGTIVTPHPSSDLSLAERRPDPVNRSHRYAKFRGVPFIKGTKDRHEVALNDVRQGSLGDCYFMAGLAAVARSDPHRIQSMIKEQDGRFLVYMWRHNDQWEEEVVSADGFYTPIVSATRIEVENEFPSSNNGRSPVYAEYGDTRKDGDETLYELWPMILEKAWAQHKKSYKNIEGGWASTAMSFFSAKEIWDGNPRELSDAELLRRLKYAERMNYPVTMGVPKPGGDRRLNVYANHYYVFKGFDERGRVRLYNPWGSSHPTRALSIEEVKRLFDGLHIGKF